MDANLATYETIAAMQDHGGPQAKALASLWMATPDPVERAVIQQTWGHIFKRFKDASPYLYWTSDGQAA